MFRSIFASLILLAALPLQAGPQLSPHELVKRSDAIAQIKVSWDTADQTKPAQITVLKWLKRPVPNILQNIDQNPQAKEKWVGLCLPDNKLLAHWIKTYPHFEKPNIQLWQNALQKGSFTSVVYFRPSPVGGAFKPTCETEALLAHAWESHPQFAAYQKKINAQLKKLEAKPKTPQPPKAQPVAEKQPPPKQKGCSCQSSL